MFLWGSARIGAGANAAEGILSPQIQFASPEPTASVSQLCKAASGLFQRDSVVSGWLGMGVVDDDGGIPGSFPPAGRLPVKQWRAHGTHRSRCGKLLDRDADSRNFRHFPVSSESQQPVFNMTNCETWFRWKPKNRWKKREGESRDDQILIFCILQNRASPTPPLHCPR